MNYECFIKELKSEFGDLIVIDKIDYVYFCFYDECTNGFVATKISKRNDLLSSVHLVMESYHEFLQSSLVITYDEFKNEYFKRKKCFA
ncbi:hypothetical protein C9J48_01510 [Photobacterium profundum]|uniref:Uncharacterized protein n=1 Tax=Photobacterium profundum 3TCK TaxID=314280 RepID=Q1Z5B8_9GAMM|nr:hypothetical protein P3TCK_17752 [Photobacterium profundum 3TCK]PSV64171.1 hypothetical protein C9J48_01510 [Photobacterium profundum]